MLKPFQANDWHYLLFCAIILLAAWQAYKHNRGAARKGENPHPVNFRFGRNSFRKRTEPPYTQNWKINRNWEP